MSGVWIPPGKQRFVDPDTGLPLVGGFVYFYIPSSSTPKDTWQDEALSILNTNPVQLDGDGQAMIWGQGLYRQVLQRSDHTQVWDQVTGFLDGGAGVVFATPAQVAALAATDLVISPYALGASGVLGGGGGSGYGSHKPLSTFGTLSLDGTTVGSNDTILNAAEADATSLRFYSPYGIIRTNLAASQLTKGYNGDAGLICGPGAGDGAYRPPNFAYMAVKPSTWPVQGDGGFWRGDNRFNDGGEWKIIGPDVRTYDITQRYFEQNVIPRPAWLDTLSGASGIDAYLTSGASIGDSTITINGPATAGWIGKTVAFANGPDGAVVESHTVTNVSGSTIIISPATLSHNYVWNPGAGQTPCIFFGHRSSASLRYTKVRHAGAGDSYIDVARQNVNYVPLASQYHPFMTATGGQYGGDVTFNADGVYGQFFESQLQGQTFDVTAIGFVGSYVRNKDDDPHYKFWGGLWQQSGGGRPADAANVVLGPWRNGFDTVFATLEETALTNGAVSAGATTITLNSVNGAHPNDTFVIGSESKVIQSVNLGAKQVTLTTAVIGSYADKTLVVFTKGGAAINLASTQRIIWNSSLSVNNRGGDPAGVYPTPYGNVQGDLIMESGTDVSSEYWSVRFARGTTAAAPDTARIRLRPTGINFFGTGAHTFAGTSVGLGAGCDFNLTTGQLLTLGTGCSLHSDGVHIYATAGATTVTIV